MICHQPAHDGCHWMTHSLSPVRTYFVYGSHIRSYSYLLFFLSLLPFLLVLPLQNQSMGGVPMSGNRHPVDQLADIRSEIRRLQAEEELLRTHVLEHRDDLIGAEHVATISGQDRKRVDLKGLKLRASEPDEAQDRRRHCQSARAVEPSATAAFASNASERRHAKSVACASMLLPSPSEPLQ